MKKVLIIKTGHSELFHDEINEMPSYGDVLRTSVILNLYKELNVYWLTDSRCFSLVKKFRKDNFHVIDKNHRVIGFDIIINLEKDSEMIDLFLNTSAKIKSGFIKDGTGKLKFLVLNNEKKIEPSFYNREILFQEKIFGLLGEKWFQEEYHFSNIPIISANFDIGLNWKVGSKWPTKLWPRDHWNQLYDKLIKKNTVSWQEGFENLEDYISWISRCKVVVTADSLGLHLAIALKKKFVAIFGPTSPGEIYSYNRGIFLLPAGDLTCLSCYLSTCPIDLDCMRLIHPNIVYDNIMKQVDGNEIE